MTAQQEKKTLVFFVTSDDGKRLFYPWAMPGEAFYITPEQERKIKRLMKWSGDLSCCILLGALGLDWMDYLPNNVLYYLTALVAIVFSIPYAAYAYALSKRTEKLRLTPEARPVKNNGTVVIWAMPFLIQTLALLTMIDDNVTPLSLRIIMAVLCLTYAAFGLWFIRTLAKTNGYFFSR